MSQVMFLFVTVICLWSEYVDSWVLTDINEELLTNIKNYGSGSTKIAFIYPGTKWCGAGNIAKNYDDLGSERETDSCCRQHDHCPDDIAGGDTKHGLTNTAFYTRLTCDCDEQFRTCLHNANKFSADAIGIIYFDGLNTQCFNNTYPITGCAKRGGLYDQKCLEYTYDTNGEMKYQWFDEKNYA